MIQYFTLGVDANNEIHLDIKKPGKYFGGIY
jgi:hypothetical protein